MNNSDWVRAEAEAKKLVGGWVRVTLINNLEIHGVLTRTGNLGLHVLPKDAHSEVNYDYDLIEKVIPYDKGPAVVLSL